MFQCSHESILSRVFNFRTLITILLFLFLNSLAFAEITNSSQIPSYFNKTINILRAQVIKTVNLATGEVEIPYFQRLEAGLQNDFEGSSEFGINVIAGDTAFVINTNDSGAGSFRQAVADANGAGSTIKTIAFNIPTSDANYDGINDVWTIYLTSTYLSINASATNLVIDGITQPGASCGTTVDANGIVNNRNLKIQLDGSGLTSSIKDGIIVNTSNVLIKGFSFTNFEGNAIDGRSTANGLIIQCNHIGTDASGTIAGPNGESFFSRGALYLYGCENLLIGGSQIGQGNIISNSKYSGIYFARTDSVSFLRNLIGTDVTGMIGMPNNTNKLLDAGAIYGYDNSNLFIGDNTFDNRNIISGNWCGGIVLAKGDNFFVKNNFVGFAADGNTELANTNPDESVKNISFGTITGSGHQLINNVVGAGGFYVSGSNNMDIKGNLIGLGANQQTIINDRRLTGIYLSDITNTNVGGKGLGEGNIVVNFEEAGLYILSYDSINVFGNVIGLSDSGTISTGNLVGMIVEVGNIANGTINIGDGTIEGANYISGNESYGIIIHNTQTGNLIINKNYIGTQIDGVTPAGNGTDPMENGSGIYTSFLSNATIINNTIVNNADRGITHFEGTGLSILQNTIYDNGNIGIDIGDDGVSPHDTYGLGANNSINYPIIAYAYVFPTYMKMRIGLDAPAGDYRLDIYTNPATKIDTSGFGEGYNFESFTTIAHTGGMVYYTDSLMGDYSSQLGEFLTMTLTECTNAGCTTYGSSSEFGENVEIAIPTELCDNGIDDDCDGLTDCEDPDCGNGGCLDANPDTILTMEEMLVNIEILTNDSLNIPMEPDSLKTINTAVNGSLSVNTDSTISYLPNVDFVGLDSFSYQICNQFASVFCDTAWVIITVSNVNDPPVIMDPSTGNPIDTIRISLTEDTEDTTCVSISDQDEIFGDMVTCSIFQDVINGTSLLQDDTCIVYTPTLNYTGQDTLLKIACDNSGACDTTVFIYTVTPINDPPVIIDPGTGNPVDTIRITLTEDTKDTTCVSLSDPDDPYGDIVTCAVYLDVMNGSSLILNDTCIVYSPTLNYTGSDTLIKIACDLNGLCDTTVFIYTINPVNDPPVISDPGTGNPLDTIRITLAEDSKDTTCVSLGDPDEPYGDMVTGSIFQDVMNGMSLIQDDTCIVYTPTINYTGQDTLIKIACDLSGICDTTIFIYTITPINDSPIISDPATGNPVDTIRISLTEDAKDTTCVSLSDPDKPYGDMVTCSIFQDVMNGSSLLQDDTCIVYTPISNYTGQDTLIKIACDLSGVCDTTVFIYTITPENDPPVISDPKTGNPADTIRITLAEETIDTTCVSLSDPDQPYGDMVTCTIFQDVMNGMSLLQDDTCIVYSPTLNYTGQDTLIKIACDLSGVCDTIVFIYTVTPINDPPVISDPATGNPVDTIRISLTEDAKDTTCISLSDPDEPYGDMVTCSVFQDVSNGASLLQDDTCVLYMPSANFVGQDTLIKIACDISGVCDTTIFIYTITPVNDPPVISDPSTGNPGDTIRISVLEDTKDTTCVSLGDPDEPYGDMVTCSIFQDVMNGSSLLQDDTCIVYTPTMSYNGQDTLIKIACDLSGVCDTTVFIYTVLPVNNPPVISDPGTANPIDTIRITLDEDTKDTTCLSLSDLDEPYGDVVTCSVFQNVSNGTSILLQDTCIVYSPTLDFSGQDTLIKIACDLSGICDTTVFIYTIIPVNDPPVISDPNTGNPVDTIRISLAEDDKDTTCISLSDPDESYGDMVTCSIFQDVTNGISLLQDDTCIVYTPIPNYVGQDTLIKIACDLSGICDTTVFIYSVTPVNDPPIISDPNTGNPVDTIRIALIEDTKDTTCLSLSDLDEPYGDMVSCAIFQNVVNGTSSFQDDTCIVYTPNMSYNGQDTLIKIACDDSGSCDTTVFIYTVLPVNNPPVISDPSTGNPIDTIRIALAEDTKDTTCISLSDPDEPYGDMVSCSIFKDVAFGTSIIQDDTCIVYSPTLNYVGQDTLIKIACDLSGVCDTTVFIYTIIPVNDPPVIADPDTGNPVDTIRITLVEDAKDTTCVSLSDPDEPYGDLLACSIYENVVYGTSLIQDDTCMVYTPTSNYVGQDTLIKITCDLSGVCDTTVFIYTITPVNDPPVIADPATGNPIDTIRITLAEDGKDTTCVSLSDPDEPYGDLVTCSIFQDVTNGATVLQEDTCIVFTPTLNYVGQDTLIKIACDLSGICDTTVFIYTITPVNDPPVIVDPNTGNPVDTIRISLLEDTKDTTCVSLSDPDEPYGDMVNCSVFQDVMNGSSLLQDDTCIVYTPTTNYNGQDTLIKIACDDSGSCDTTVFIYTILPVNNPPVISDPATGNPVDTIRITLAEDGKDTTCVSLSDPDEPYGDMLSCSFYQDVTNGSSLVQDDTCIVYTPTANFSGQDTLIKIACDLLGICDTTIFIYTVTPVNDPPIITDPNTGNPSDTIRISLAEDTKDTTCVSLSDLDEPYGDMVTCAIFQDVANGGNILLDDTCIVYTPTTNYNGQDTLIKIACDQSGICDTTVFIYTITPTNDSPVISNPNTGNPIDTIRISLAEDSKDTTCVSLGDPDEPYGDMVTCTVYQDVTNGASLLLDDTCVVYTPTLNFVGQDTLIKIACDNSGICDTTVFIYTINPINDAPVIADPNTGSPIDTIRITLAEDTKDTTCVSLGDPDEPYGDMVTCSVYQDVTNGTSLLQDDTCIIYTPTTNYNGQDTLIKIACDNSGICDTTVFIYTITPVNDVPIISDPNTGYPVDTIWISLAEDTKDTTCVNLTDLDEPYGDMVTCSIFLDVSNGTSLLHDDTCIVYTPTANYVGQDTLIKIACDNSGVCDTTVFVYSVSPVNDAPVISDPNTGNPVDTILITLAEDSKDTTCVSLGDPDEPYGDMVTCSIYQDVSNGTSLLQDDTCLVYTPTANYNGQDTLIKIACDNSGICDTTVLIYTITPVNDEPVSADPATGNPVDTIRIALIEDTKDTTCVSLSDPDEPYGDMITCSVILDVTNGTSLLQDDTCIVYSPTISYNGQDTLIKIACDNSGICDTTVFIYTVLPVNNPPIISDPSTGMPIDTIRITLAEDTRDTTCVSLSDPDEPYGDMVTCAIYGDVSNGTSLLLDDTCIVYTPSANYNGQDTLIKIACDLLGVCDTTIFIYTVTPVNDPPIIINPNTGNPSDTIRITLEESTKDTTCVSLGDPDEPYGDMITCAIFQDVINGTSLLLDDTCIVYSPTVNYNGQDTLIKIACDNSGVCDTTVIIYSVLPVNDPPVISDPNTGNPVDTIRITLAEDSRDTTCMSLSDPDEPYGDMVTCAVFDDVSNGISLILGDTCIVYIPTADYNGQDTLIKIACDLLGFCDTTVFIYTITPVNDPPVFNAGNPMDTIRITLVEDSKDTTCLSLSDKDEPYGDLVTCAIFQSVINGTSSMQDDTCIVYTPNLHYYGQDTLIKIACDLSGVCDTTVVIYTITPVNDDPVISDPSTGKPIDTIRITLAEDTKDTTCVSLSDPDEAYGDMITCTIYSDVSNGNALLQSDTCIVYSPNLNYVGQDTLIKIACDLVSVCDTTVLIYTITPVNDNPIILDPATGNPIDTIRITLAEDTQDTTCISLTDPDLPYGDMVSCAVYQDVSNGTSLFLADTCIVYTPNMNYNGQDVLVKIACDNSGVCDTTIIIYTITPVNDSPIAIDDLGNNGIENQSLTIDVQANDIDVDGDDLITTIISNPTDGATQLLDGDSVLYTPISAFFGRDTFSYSICDPFGQCDTALVYVKIGGVNDAPIAVDDFRGASGPIKIEVQANDSDIDYDLLTTRIIVAPIYGTASEVAGKDVHYIPPSAFDGLDTLTYELCDNGNPILCDTAIVVIPIVDLDTIYPPAPVDPMDTITVCQTFEWLTLGPISATDCNNQTSGTASPSGGTYTIDPLTGCVTYVPPIDITNTMDEVCLVICDANNICDTTIIIIPLDTIDVAYPPCPVEFGGTKTVCVDTSWITKGPIYANGCDGLLNGTAHPNNGAYSIDPLTGCVTYTAPADIVLTSQDTVCVVLCDANGICDTSDVVFPLDTTRDLMLIPVYPGQPEVDYLDLSWVTKGPLTVTDCQGKTTGQGNPVKGNYTLFPDGSIEYTAPYGALTPYDTVCVVVCDANGVCNITTIIYEILFAPTPVIIDPCNCLANESSFGAGDGQFSEYIRLTAHANENWRLAGNQGFYQNPTAPIFPPPSSVGGPYPLTSYQTGYQLVEVPIDDEFSNYYIYGIHVDGIGYNLEFTNGKDTLAIGQTCVYDNSCRFNIEVDPDGTPGVPMLDSCAQNLLIGTNGVKQIDSLLCCVNNTTFEDDGTSTGLYLDTMARNDVFTICPQNQWQTMTYVFDDFSLGEGDTLYVFDGRQRNPNALLLKAGGEGVSQTGGWVSSTCSPNVNASGCLTFAFITNGDNDKGRGWAGEFACEERDISLTPPNDLNATLDCETTYTNFEIKLATVNTTCNMVEDSQLVRVYNDLGDLCVDTCLAGNETVTEFFALGRYLVEYKLKADTFKTTSASLTVQSTPLVCNDRVVASLGSACALTVSPDILLEGDCPPIPDTMYYHIILSGKDKNGNKIVLAEGGKDGAYPTVTKAMLNQIDSTLSATVEKRYYEGLNLSFCNNGVYSQTCETQIEVIDNSAPVFTGVTTDTLVLCSFDLTEEGLGLTPPTAFDNCGAPEVNFGEAIIVEDGGGCAPTKIEVSWIVSDELANTTTLRQTVIVLRPDLKDILKTPDVTLSCGEDGENDFNNLDKISIPRVEIGRIKDGVLIPSDTIDLNTETYVCGYILQKRDVIIDADCGIKLFRYWEVIDWCDTDGGLMNLDTQLIELKDTLAPEFVANELIDSTLALPDDDCVYNINQLANPEATDNCSLVTVRKDKVSRIENGELWDIPLAEWSHLPADSFLIQWVAEDACHEQTKNDTLTQVIVIEDQTKPTVICTDYINLALPSEETKLFYHDIDAGSYDACGIVKYEISRDEENWDESVIISCADAHLEVPLYLRVTDKSGNQNICWVTIRPQDTIAPLCSPLEAQSETCDVLHREALGLPTDINGNGNMDEDEWMKMTDQQIILYNEKYGNPVCSDNLSCRELIIEQEYQLVEKLCGIAEIKRRYRALDWNGEGNVSDWAYQTIHIEYLANWSLTLPADWMGVCGDSIPDTDLLIKNSTCDAMSVDIRERVIQTGKGECKKILRQFTFTNLCTYKTGQTTLIIDRKENAGGVVENSEEITFEGMIKGQPAANVGRFKYTQILELQDNTPPVFNEVVIDSCFEAVECKQVKWFDITATDCAESDFTSLTYNWTLFSEGLIRAFGEGNGFEHEVEAKQLYTVRWSVADACGNVAWKNVDYYFEDCKKPSPYCLHGLAIDLIDESGKVTVKATDISLNSNYSCPDENNLSYRLWHASLGEVPNNTTGVKALPENITFNCMNLGNQEVYLYAIDGSNNWDFCTTYINVQDNTNACEVLDIPTPVDTMTVDTLIITDTLGVTDSMTIDSMPMTDSMAMVTGIIMDWSQRTINDVEVSAAAANYTTAADGHYQLALAMGRDYNVQPFKNTDPLNGVTTFDLVLITKHILGINALDNPYKKIAADANRSGSITAFDMVQIRRLILTIDTEFSNNTSWRFMEAGFELDNDNPLGQDFSENSQINNLEEDMEVDFIAIKVGDVNGSANPNNLILAEERSTGNYFEIKVEDRFLKAGETAEVVFRSMQMADIQGYQFTLAFDNLKMHKMEQGMTKAENFGMHKMDQHYITTSWHEAKNPEKPMFGAEAILNKMPPKTELFTLVFTALHDGKLSEHLSLQNRPTLIEAYNMKDEIIEVKLTFTNSMIMEKFELEQNQPNPFQSTTAIDYSLPGDSEVTLVLRNEVGAIVRIIKENGKTGKNRIILNDNDLPGGLIYYQLNTKYGSKAKKMLHVR